jgi:prepilin signal peptidase PulO-like enzyme (type II secretory pathway)
VTAGLVVVASVGAGLCVRGFGRTARARWLWWVGAALAAAGAAAATGSPVPAAAGLAGSGLAAAAVIDGAEGRIPTALAHGTTAMSSVLLVGHGFATGEWALVARAVALTAALVSGLVVVWLLGGMGFADVRLASATVTAMAGGVSGLVALVAVASLGAGTIAMARRLAGRGGDHVPFGPPLAAGWLFSIWIV